VRLADITIQGNSAVSAEELSAVVAEQVNGAYLFLFPKDNVFLYPSRAIRETILDRFKRVSSVDVRLSGFMKPGLVVTVNERSPFALWCGVTQPMPDKNESHSCTFTDSTGFIFGFAPRISPGVYFELYGPLSTATGTKEIDNSPIGKNFLTPDRFTRVLHFKDMLDDIDIKARSLVVNENGFAEFSLSDAGVITFDPHDDLLKVFSNLKAAIAKKTTEEGAIAWDKLEYIDLRFSDKVIFKFRQ